MDQDVFAYLYPHNDSRKGATKAIEANSRYAPPLLQPTEDRHSHRSHRDRHQRELTEPPENPGAVELDYLPSLAVRFSDVPRTDNGLIFGSNSICDVVLRATGVSNVHFCLTFDEFNRPIIKDMNSSMGTQVTYDSGGKGFRRDFSWIVGGHGIPQKMQSIIITIPDTISFQIIVPSYDITSPAYIDQVNRFKQGTATAEDLLDDLGLSYPPTRPRTGANTPGTGEIHLRKKLGEGSFGAVTHLWNVSTGDEQVVKAPTSRAVRKKKVDKKAWHREAHIMAQISHDHIVRFIRSSFTPHPQIFMEYVPCGSLDDQEAISYNEILTILRQCLSALVYLHGLEPPIAHRDIKPANILVHYRFDGDIYVKLGDFGLSRDKAELMTLCGSAKYLAPEIYSEIQRCAGNKARVGYTPAVDVWSLGVVACQLACGLPDYEDRYWNSGTVWCERIVAWAQEVLKIRPNAIGQCLLHTMVVLKPEQRFSADACLDAVEDLVSTEEASLHRSTPAPYSEGEGQATFRYALQNQDTEDLSSVIYQPRSTAAATSSYFVRSPAPPPESLSSSSRMTQQFQEPEEPSSSVMRQYGNWAEGHEMAQFLEDYSPDPFNSLYVGSSLAAELGGDNSEDWATQFFHDSSQQDQVQALAAETGAVEGGIAIGADGYEEMAQAAYMLQALGQEFRAS